MSEKMYREFPAKLVYNHGWWFVTCEQGTIDLGDMAYEDAEVLRILMDVEVVGDE